MRNKFAYSCSMKTHAVIFDILMEGIFYLLLVVETFSLPKVVKILEEVVAGWQEVSWIWQMRQNFIAQLVQLLNRWWWDMQSGVVLEENWALSVDQCQLQEWQFSVPLVNLLSILLRCNGFTGIQKIVVDQKGNRPLKSDHDLFWVQVWFGKCFEASQSNHWADCHRLSLQSTSHCSSQSNDCKMVNVEFFSNFPCRCKRITFNEPQLVIVYFWWLTTMHLIFKALISFAKFLDLPLNCTCVSISRAKCVADVVSSLHCFTTCFELE